MGFESCFKCRRRVGTSESIKMRENLSFIFLMLAYNLYRPMTESRVRPTLFIGTSSGNCQETETGVARACTRHDSLSKTILQGTLRVGDAVVGRENAGWTFLPKPELLTMSLLHKDWKDIC